MNNNNWIRIPKKSSKRANHILRTYLNSDSKKIVQDVAKKEGDGESDLGRKALEFYINTVANDVQGLKDFYQNSNGVLSELYKEVKEVKRLSQSNESLLKEIRKNQKAVKPSSGT
ncbi:hypothetical protein GOV04_05000 [Candidatus Woesearchaeota archaeon]|nr:hypothetical protein [Candidatus Woesearchaeota archaeon]